MVGSGTIAFYIGNISSCEILSYCSVHKLAMRLNVATKTVEHEIQEIFCCTIRFQRIYYVENAIKTK